jgi:hypothetical protein
MPSSSTSSRASWEVISKAMLAELVLSMLMIVRVRHSLAVMKAPILWRRGNSQLQKITLSAGGQDASFHATLRHHVMDNCTQCEQLKAGLL